MAGKKNNKKSIVKKNKEKKENKENEEHVSLSAEEQSEFIAQIKFYPILWDKNEKDFKNTKKKGSICDTIGSIYDIPCKLKTIFDHFYSRFITGSFVYLSILSVV